jgi:hypothetical protein
MSPKGDKQIMHGDKSGRRKRPALVWVIVIICLLGTIVPWLSYIMVGFGVIPVTSAAQAYFARSATRYYMFSAVYSTVTVAAAGSLFLLKRAAPYLFIVTLALYMLSIRLFEATEVNAGLGSYSNPQEFTKLVFQLGVIYYCWRLAKRGVLS